MTTLFDGGGAAISGDGLFRYRLWRDLDDSATKRTMAFVMLNPSTADANLNDPTIRRCIKFAQREGCNRLEVINQYAWRTPSPAALKAASLTHYIAGPDNRQHWRDVLSPAAIVVAAWGASINAWSWNWWNPQPFTTVPVMCLGTTADGSPKHPLARGKHRIPDGQPLEPWPS